MGIVTHASTSGSITMCARRTAFPAVSPLSPYTCMYATATAAAANKWDENKSGVPGKGRRDKLYALHPPPTPCTPDLVVPIHLSSPSRCCTLHMEGGAPVPPL